MASSQAPGAQTPEGDTKSLWSHLIRHVNRAHDELYVMCEAESSRRKCDEALALLSSAAEDFAEVRARGTGRRCAAPCGFPPAFAL